jgi:hypothetical protein
MSRTDRPPYPPDWKEIVAAVRARASDSKGVVRCECSGECGDPHLRDVKTGKPRCNAPDKEIIKRNHEKPWIWYYHELCGICMAMGHVDAGDPPEPITVKLTTAHVCRPASSGDHSLGNLKALCQRCHLRLDRAHHQGNAAATRRRKLGNLELFP